jgi:hypothetical protein
MNLPKLVKIEWENGDVTQGIPRLEFGDCYYFDIKESGCYWAHKCMCTPIDILI